LALCPRKIQYQWNVVESNLRQFTQGDEQVYSNWNCTSRRISVNARIVPDDTPAGSDLGILYSSRTETVLLS
jgi:hypothetical protein